MALNVTGQFDIFMFQEAAQEDHKNKKACHRVMTGFI